MKATELQCGDLILVDGKPTRVYGVMQRMNRIYDTMTNDISMRRCEPIPLTAEILEKNGWERDRIFMEKRVDENTHFSWTDRYGAVLYQNNYHMCDCKDVHTLQHALRLCGLNELADNFKVE